MFIRFAVFQYLFLTCLIIESNIYNSLHFNSDTKSCLNSEIELTCKVDPVNINFTLKISKMKKEFIPPNNQELEENNSRVFNMESFNGLVNDVMLQAYKKHSIIIQNKTFFNRNTAVVLKHRLGSLTEPDFAIYFCLLVPEVDGDATVIGRYMHLSERKNCEKMSSHRLKIILSIVTLFIIIFLILLIIYCYDKASNPIPYKLVHIFHPEKKFMEDTKSSEISDSGFSEDPSNLESTKAGNVAELPILHPVIETKYVQGRNKLILPWFRGPTNRLNQLMNMRTTLNSNTTIMNKLNKNKNDLAYYRSALNDKDLQLISHSDQKFCDLYRIIPDPQYELPRSNLCLQSCLGEGAFGIVFRGIATNLPKSKCLSSQIVEVAVKTLRDNFTESELFEFLKEMDIMKQLHNEHVIELYAVCTQNGKPYLVMEYAPYGNLRDYLRKNKNRFNMTDSNTVKKLLDYGCQVAKGMNYLGLKSIIHRDLAARNILIGKDYKLKIADFGLTRSVEYYYRKLTNGRVPVKWLAPESLFDRIYTNKSDIWSFGVLLWEIFTFGSPPFQGIEPSTIPNLIRSGVRNPKPNLASNEIYSIMLNCWNFDPHKRPKFSELVNLLNHLKYESKLDSNPIGFTNLNSGKFSEDSDYSHNYGDSELS